MNHLHQLIEARERNDIFVLDDLPNDHAKAADVFLSIKADEAICFDMGPVDLIDSVSHVPQLVRLPYPVCWFEGTVFRDGKATVVGALASCLDSENPNHIALFVFRHGAGLDKWAIYGMARLAPEDDRVDVAVSHTDLESKETSVPYGICSWVCSFLSALHCTNVERIEERPPEKLQKARRRRGKKPLFSTWTLCLALPRLPTDRSDQGGTHSSPRLHLRRGHHRQYVPGKWCWVEAHVVGNKAMGLVHKDYQVVPRDEDRT